MHTSQCSVPGAPNKQANPSVNHRSKVFCEMKRRGGRGEKYVYDAMLEKSKRT